MRRIKIETRDGQHRPTISPKELFDSIMTEAKLQSKLPHNLIPEHQQVDTPKFKIYHIKGDKHKIVAYSPEGFLHQLHIGSRFDSEGTDTEYMHSFAHRLQELEGYLVSTESPEAFLSDLLAHGFVVEEI